MASRKTPAAAPKTGGGKTAAAPKGGAKAKAAPKAVEASKPKVPKKPAKAIPKAAPEAAPRKRAVRSPKSAPPGPDRLAMIAEAAYFRAESRGFAPGAEVQDWLEAEAEIERLLAGR